MEIITLDLQFEQIRHDFIPLRHEIEKRLIDSDLLFKINEIRRYFFKAFKLIKQESNFIESKELIDQGIEHRSNIVENQLAIGLILSIELPILAFYEYRKNNYTNALNLLNQAMFNEDYLIINGFDLLQYRKVELFINIAKVYLKVGCCEKASIEISKAICGLVKFVPNEEYNLVDHSYFTNDTFSFVLNTIDKLDQFYSNFEKKVMSNVAESNILVLDKPILLSRELYTNLLNRCHYLNSNSK